MKFSLPIGLLVGSLVLLTFAGCGSSRLAQPHPPLESGGVNQAKDNVQELEQFISTPWLEPAARARQLPQGFQLTDQNGVRVDSGVSFDQCTVISFFYTRCQNPNKCPAVARNMARLHELIVNQGLQSRVSLQLMTFDPEFDVPERLKEYAVERGFKLSPAFSMVRPDPLQKQKFFEAMGAAVNFGQPQVNLHAIQLLIFDQQKRFVRAYHTVLWDNQTVLRDLNRLLAEPSGR